MDAFSYLSVLLSVIIGLTITQILQGYRVLLLHRARIKLALPPLIWSALILVIATQMWWASFGLADHSDWNFAAFGEILLQTVMVYMMSALVLPDAPADTPMDLAEHYARERVPFFLFAVAGGVTSILKDLTIDGYLPTPANLAFHAVYIGGNIAAIFVRDRRFHIAHALFFALAFGIYIALLFAHL